MSIRVALADDQELVRAGLAMVIDACDDMRVVAQAGDGAQALDEMSRHTADIVLTDVQMPRMNGVDATVLITARDDGPKVIVLTPSIWTTTPAPPCGPVRAASCSRAPRPPT